VPRSSPTHSQESRLSALCLLLIRWFTWLLRKRHVLGSHRLLIIAPQNARHRLIIINRAMTAQLQGALTGPSSSSSLTNEAPTSMDDIVGRACCAVCCVWCFFSTAAAPRNKPMARSCSPVPSNEFHKEIGYLIFQEIPSDFFDL
jgi:hypothetical protein